jgi:hypothetical protein
MLGGRADGGCRRRGGIDAGQVVRIVPQHGNGAIRIAEIIRKRNGRCRKIIRRVDIGEIARQQILNLTQIVEARGGGLQNRCGHGKSGSWG